MSISKKQQIRSLKEVSCVVTGGGGFLGSCLVEQLLQQEASVLAIDSSIASCSQTSGQNSRLLRMNLDLRDLEPLQKAIHDFSPEIIFHLACCPDGQETFEQIKSSVNQNLFLTINSLEAFSKSLNNQLFVYGDSVKVYGNGPVPYRETLAPNPNSSYAIGKHAGWLYCRLYYALFGTR